MRAIGHHESPTADAASVDTCESIADRSNRDGRSTRILLTITTAFLLVALPIGPHRFALAVLVVIVQGLASVVTTRLRANRETRFIAYLLVEQALALVCAVVAPAVYVATSMVVIGSLGTNSSYLSRRHRWWLATSSVVAVIAPALVHHVDHAPAIIGVGLMLIVHIVANRAGSVVLAEEAADQARYQADHDPLTGLANRRILRQAITDLVATDHVGLLLVDLDNFKEVNDTLGHDFGDHVLVAVSQRLSTIDPWVLVVRLGGDEFAALVRGGPDLTQAVADRIRFSLGAPMTIDGVEIVVRASIGMVHTDRVEADRLLRSADVAMYRAKREGIHSSWYRSEDDPYSERRLQLVQELPDAIPNGGIRVWFQPQIELTSGRTVGAEALVRWHHPRWGIIGAGELLHYTAMAGLESALTREVLRQALDVAVGWPDHVGLSVNITLSDAGSARFCADLERRLSLTGFAPSRLTVEIVEADREVDAVHLVERVARIRALGVCVSLDDFGQASSSLARLDLFDVDELKIDRRFISRMSHEPRAAAIVDSVVALADRLGLRVVAEGVETIDEAHAVADAGIDVVQGFYFARPAERLVSIDHGPVLARRLQASGITAPIGQ